MGSSIAQICIFRGTTRDEYVARVCAGGLPLAVRRSQSARARWFDDFVRQSVERDALELSQVRQRQSLADLLARLASQTGQLLNITKAAEAVSVERKTAEAHLRLLEDLFLVIRLPAWGKTLRSRVSVRPKVHLVDSGLAARLLRLTPVKLATLDPAALTEFGNLLETFVVGELRKQASWLDVRVALGHWRTSDGAEVDLVAEFDDGQVVAFEVKANERATSGIAEAGRRGVVCPLVASGPCSGDGFEVQSQAEGPRDLNDRGEARVPVGGECLVETFAAHADLAGQFADVAGAGDDAERLGNEGRVVACLLAGCFEVGGSILGAGQIVGRVVG